MKVMADGRSSDQPAPWRSRNTHNRANRATHTIPTTTIVLAGGDSIVLNHATTNQISEIYRAVDSVRDTPTRRTPVKTARPRHRSGPRPSKTPREGKDARQWLHLGRPRPQENREQSPPARRKRTTAYTVAPNHQAQHGHTTEDEPAQTASDTNAYEEAECTGRTDAARTGQGHAGRGRRRTR